MVHVSSLKTDSDGFFFVMLHFSEPVGSNTACWKITFWDIINCADTSSVSTQSQLFFPVNAS